MTFCPSTPAAVRRSLVLALLVTVAAVGTSCGSVAKDTDAPKTTATASSYSSAVEVLLDAGISQTKAHLLSQAVTTFKDVLILSPKNVYALYNLGVIDQAQGKTAGALSYYSLALSADSTYTPAMYNKAIILEGSDLDAALALYKRIVTLDPKASTAYLRMAFVYAKQGQPLKAAAARAKAIALDPGLAKYPLPAKCTRTSC